MKTVCITGVGGYIGEATATALAGQGHKVIGIGHSKESPGGLMKQIEYRSCDIADTEALTRIIVEMNVETVFHFAGNKYAGLCEQDPAGCFRVNTEGTKSVLDAMRKAEVPNLVFASTYAVYDFSGDALTLTEKSPTNPQSVYGKSKLAAERLIREYAESGYLKRWHILRYSNVIGPFPGVPYRSTRNFIDIVLEKVRAQQPIQIFGAEHATKDGSVARDFIALQDVVSAHCAILLQNGSGIYNVSTGRATTLLEIVALIRESLGVQVMIETLPEQRPEPSSVTVVNNAIIQDVAWQPKLTIEETIRAIVRSVM